MSQEGYKYSVLYDFSVYFIKYRMVQNRFCCNALTLLPHKKTPISELIISLFIVITSVLSKDVIFEK